MYCEEPPLDGQLAVLCCASSYRSLQVDCVQIFVQMLDSVGSVGQEMFPALRRVGYSVGLKHALSHSRLLDVIGSDLVCQHLVDLLELVKSTLQGRGSVELIIVLGGQAHRLLHKLAPIRHASTYSVQY